MEQELINSLFELKDEIYETSEYKNYILLEHDLENNDEVAILSYKKDIAIMNYEDTLKHFKKGTEEEKKSFVEMKKSIDALNEHEVVKKYNEALTKLNLLMSEIEKKIFEGIHD